MSSKALAALGLPDASSPVDIKARWLELARQNHPDKGGTAEEFHRLKAAFDEAYADARTEPCGECQGGGRRMVHHGFHAISVPCDACEGTGKKYRPA